LSMSFSVGVEVSRPMPKILSVTPFLWSRCHFRTVSDRSGEPIELRHDKHVPARTKDTASFSLSVSDRTDLLFQGSLLGGVRVRDGFPGCSCPTKRASDSAIEFWPPRACNGPLSRL
jgi:hypothetical protein